MATTTRHSKASSYNLGCNTPDNGDPLVLTTNITVTVTDSIVPTTSFSTEIAAVPGGDEHLVFRNHTVFYTISNVELPILSHSRHAAHYALHSATSDVQFLLPTTIGSPSPSAFVLGVQPSSVINTTTQYPCSSVAGGQTCIRFNYRDQANN